MENNSILLELENCKSTNEAILIIKSRFKTINEIRNFASSNNIEIFGKNKNELIQSLAYNVIGFKLVYTAITND